MSFPMSFKPGFCQAFYGSARFVLRQAQNEAAHHCVMKTIQKFLDIFLLSAIISLVSRGLVGGQSRFLLSEVWGGS
jgi:hypothetical protein